MINLHKGQSEVFNELFIEKLYRFMTVVCSRGWGKSYFGGVTAVTAIFELLELDLSTPNKNVYIIAPTFDQVADIYYPLLNYDLGMESYCIKSSRDTGRFKFPKNVELRLISYEAVERLRGKGCYFAVWDEVSSCKRGIDTREAWDDIIQPTIITRWSPKRAKLFGAPSPGRGLIIGTPKGYNFLYDLHNKSEIDPLWGRHQYDYTQSPLLDAAEIERIRDDLDPVTFASEYLALFKESGLSIFYCFDRQHHVTAEIMDFVEPFEDNEGEVVHACIDFNVGVMATSLFAHRGNQMQFIDEIEGSPDTENLAISLKNRYPKNKIIAFPDPSGRSRKTSAAVGITDFRILEEHGIQCYARSVAPPIKDSVAAVNRMLMTASGKTSLYVHPRCKKLIKSLERTKWAEGNPNSALIDKSEGVEHFSDGVRYAAEYLHPIKNKPGVAHRGFNF